MKKAQIIMLLAALIIAMSGCAAENTTVKEMASTASDTVGTSSETLKVPEAVPDITDNAVSDMSAETTADTTSISSAETVSEQTTASETTVITTSASGSAAASENAATTEATKAPETTAAPETTTSASATTTSAAETETQSAETTTTTAVPESVQYDTSVEFSATVLRNGDSITGGTYTATGKDESVLEASGNVKASVTGSWLKKVSGDASSADESSFRGVNAGVRVYGNAEVTLKDCLIEADAQNATGVFAYDKGVIYISDSTVNVTGGGAGGVQVAGGGTLYGKNLTVTTASKAAIRSDRGGGTMVIDGGSYTSKGSSGCPVIYSTADITVKNAIGVSEQSRAVIIEGKNSVTLENCTLIGNDRSTKSGSIRANVLLYQSASGDAKEGTSVFSMTGGKMISQSGAMFYCTNTSSVVNLKAAELVLSDSGDLLIVSAGRWGKDGRNGGKCTFNAEDQTLEGNITVDSISSLELNLKNSTFKGAISNEGTVNVTLDSGSKWELTGDSYVSSFSGDVSGIVSNGYKFYVNGKQII